MIDKNSQSQTTALARSAARQLTGLTGSLAASNAQPAPQAGRRQTIHDVADLPQRARASQTPRIAPGAHGSVARAMARQSGLTLEQLLQNARISAPSTAPSPARDEHRHQSGGAPEQAHSDAVHYHTATTNCAIDKMLAMCAELHPAAHEDTEILVDALILKFVARCLTLHPTLNGAADRDTQAHSAARLAVAVRAGEQWHTPVLHDAGRLGITAIAQQIKELAGASGGHTAAQHASTFCVFNVRLQPPLAQPLNVDTACPASLTIAATPDQIAVDGGETNVAVSVRVDSRRADSLACRQFLSDLAAMFAEPRRALL